MPNSHIEFISDLKLNNYYWLYLKKNSDLWWNGLDEVLHVSVSDIYEPEDEDDYWSCYVHSDLIEGKIHIDEMYLKDKIIFKTLKDLAEEKQI